MRRGMKAASHWMEARAAWWPVLKKTKWPRRARMVGPRGETLAFVVAEGVEDDDGDEGLRWMSASNSRRERMAIVTRARVAWPMGFWKSRSGRRRMVRGRMA